MKAKLETQEADSKKALKEAQDAALNREKEILSRLSSLARSARGMRGFFCLCS